MGEAEQVCTALEVLPMRPGKGEGSYNEAWLQDLIQSHPALLPISDIEPGLAQPIPVCTELSVPSGYVDNVMITPEGGLVIIETKLWRNPEARREVVGQILDYAKDLSAFTYEDLQRQVGLARRQRDVRLFDLVRSQAEPEAEARFIDAVSRNLRLGRFLLIIAGDGVQESAEQLGDFLQRHIGLHFTLALVEISLWRAPASGAVLVQPRILAKTVQIERAVVRFEGGIATASAAIEPTAASVSKPTTLSAETFYEELAKTDPGLPARLKAFVSELESLGVGADFRKTLSLGWRTQDGRRFTVGVIDAEGRLNMDYAQYAAAGINRLDLSTSFQERLAALIPGAFIKRTPNPNAWRVVTADGKNPPIGVLLDQQQAWLSAIDEYRAALQAALAEGWGTRF